MDHIEEAKGELKRAIHFHGGNDAAVTEAEFAIKCAQINALISIAESLAKLAGCVDKHNNISIDPGTIHLAQG